jgi:uncharacterized cupin superfamily protein
VGSGDVRVFNLLGADVVEAEAPDGFHHRRASIREALGGELLGASLYEVPPGECVWPYHYHLGNEEWLVVAAGRPTLRTPAGERQLAPGDLVGFPNAEPGAHCLRNATDGPVRLAIFSTLNYGTATYPDSDKIGAGSRDDRRYFRRGDAVDYWEGEL